MWIGTCGSQLQKEMKKWGREVSEEILTEDFPNPVKDTKIHILDLPQNSSNTKTKTNTPRYILTSGEKQDAWLSKE